MRALPLSVARTHTGQHAQRAASGPTIATIRTSPECVRIAPRASTARMPHYLVRITHNTQRIGAINQLINQSTNQSEQSSIHPNFNYKTANNNKHNNIIIQQQTSTTKPSNSNKHQLLNTEGRAGGVLKRLPITEVMKRELEVLRGRRVQGAQEAALECATCHHKTQADSSYLRTP